MLVSRVLSRAFHPARNVASATATAAARQPLGRFASQSIARRLLSKTPKYGPGDAPNLKEGIGKGGPISWKSLVAMVGLGGAFVYYFNNERSKMEAERTKRARKSAGRPKLGGPYELIDTDGKKVTNETFHGQWHLLYFGFTFCPDVCPEELEKMAEVVDAIEEKKGKDSLLPIFISVDPDRDTPEKIKEYVQDFHPKMVGLTGNFDQIKHICRQFRVYYSRPEPDPSNPDYLVDHSIIQYLMAPDGQFVAYYGQNTTAEKEAASILEHMDTYSKK